MERRIQYDRRTEFHTRARGGFIVISILELIPWKCTARPNSNCYNGSNDTKPEQLELTSGSVVWIIARVLPIEAPRAVAK